MFQPGATLEEKFYKHLYIMDDKYVPGRQEPIEEGCDCEACKNHSRAYLQHLFRMNDPAAMRLANGP